MMGNREYGLSFQLYEARKERNADVTIVLYHGWGGSIENYRDMASVLADKGFTVIIPELTYHNSRNPINHFQKHVVQTYFWKTIGESIDEFHELMEVASLINEKTIVVGSSMGGFIANGIFAMHPDLKGLVNVNGSGSFVLSENLFREQDQRSELTSSEKDYLDHYDPILKGCGDGATLLIHGANDQTVSMRGQKDYYDHLIHTRGKINSKLIIFENVNHEFTPTMEEELLHWLGKM